MVLERDERRGKREKVREKEREKMSGICHRGSRLDWGALTGEIGSG